MKLQDRRQQIIDRLIEAGTVALDDLARQFGVSKMTIHRDLDDLAAAGMLRKLRGGATIESSLQFEADYRFRERRDRPEKARIAHAAAGLVEPGMTVLINDGSTAAILAEMLARRRDLTVITNNLAAINTLAGAPGVTLLALGGAYSRKFNGFFGVIAEEALARLRADIAFVSTPAILGGACYHMDDAVTRTKRQMIRAAGRACLLADQSKFGRSALHHLADLGEFAAVITGAAPAPPHADALEEAGTRLIIATEEPAS
ncbi:MAG: DeoR family transcriptional regulator [Alphaproteobacteria bacterium HGW-Alphaproteobacteria-6]|nr:MAG: DeoR family transcriptional regulator [Alphaproteobacteria bacterium HGW-Alphaproteobacteria-6]